MQERFVDIATPDGPIDTFVTHPEAGGPFACVIVFMDIWGLREELFDIARRIATVGYYCLVPNFYHRLGKVRFEFRNAAGRMISFDRLDLETRARMEKTFHALSNAMVVSDVGALIAFLRDDPATRGNAMGGIGYCMGGRHVLCAAANFPQYFVASASLHGTGLISEREDSPHLLAGYLRGEVYCGYGENDGHTPPALVAQMTKLLSRQGVKLHYLVHAGAEHGYALPDRDVFDKQAANRDWERIFAMFRRQLRLGPDDLPF
jgi:carboxymethylenebutenolidase